MRAARIIVHEAEEGGFWAEEPAIPGCVTQGENLGDLLANASEAIEGCLAVEVDETSLTCADRVVESAV